jgi:hypothetical protein
MLTMYNPAIDCNLLFLCDIFIKKALTSSLFFFVKTTILLEFLKKKLKLQLKYQHGMRYFLVIDFN